MGICKCFSAQLIQRTNPESKSPTCLPWKSRKGSWSLRIQMVCRESGLWGYLRTGKGGYIWVSKMYESISSKYEMWSGESIDHKRDDAQVAIRTKKTGLNLHSVLSSLVIWQSQETKLQVGTAPLAKTVGALASLSRDVVRTKARRAVWTWNSIISPKDILWTQRFSRWVVKVR